MTTTWTYSGFNLYSTYGELTNVVYSYGYKVTVTDGVTAASQTGFIRLNFDAISNFILFANLTPEIIQGWTEASIDTTKIINNLTEAVIAKNAVTQQNLPAPWETPAS